jgi:hypothetical protein
LPDKWIIAIEHPAFAECGGVPGAGFAAGGFGGFSIFLLRLFFSMFFTMRFVSAPTSG